MSLSSNYLDAFYACAQVGHFTRAAERLHITQSALSQRIKNLADELETSLFIRDRSGLRLTDAGEALLRYCQTKSSIEDEVVEEIKGAHSAVVSGTLRIGGFSSVMRSVIMPSLAPLVQKYPEVKLHFHTRELQELPILLKRGEIDFMVLDHHSDRSDFETLKLGEEKNVLVEKKNYKGEDIYLDHDENDQTSIRYLQMIGKKKKPQRQYLDDVYGLIDGARLGLGKAVVPRHLIKGSKDLVIVSKKNLIFPVILHYHQQPFYSRLHQTVVSTLKAESAKYL